MYVESGLVEGFDRQLWKGCQAEVGVGSVGSHTYAPDDGRHLPALEIAGSFFLLLCHSSALC